MKIERNLKSLLLASTVFFAITFTPTFAATQDQTASDENTLRSQVSDYAKAFASEDYKAIANMWAPDGTFTDIDGRVLQGRAEIESYFKENFEQFGGQKLEIVIDSIRFPSNTVAIEEGHSRPLEGPAIDNVSRYSVVHIKQNNKWQMYAATESTYADAIKGSLQDWEWLIGNWSAKPSATKKINIIATWAAGHKFIRCLFETENSTTGSQFAMLIIGQDPSSGQIISWHFDPSGGFGSGTWIKDDQTWIERASSTENDGTKGSALYTLHKLDDNTFTWHSTERYLDDSKLPDGDEVTISRVQPLSK